MTHPMSSLADAVVQQFSFPILSEEDLRNKRLCLEAIIQHNTDSVPPTLKDRVQSIYNLMEEIPSIQSSIISKAYLMIAKLMCLSAKIDHIPIQDREQYIQNYRTERE